MNKNRHDTIIWDAVDAELQRQRDHVELIASENFTDEEVLALTGSVLTNKYAEGYPRARYYHGCGPVDIIEQEAIDRAKKLFGADHANVQPHAGSQANSAAIAAVCKPGDTILGMSLDAGGHLTHGYALNFSGLNYKAIAYGLDRNELIDFEQVERLALEHKPKLIIAGASAYSRIIDWSKFRTIADKVGAVFLVDMAHIAGLVAGGVHPSPVPYADIVTTTTHKTLRGPRSGLILCKAAFAKAIDRSIFPGNQGGPLEHVIAAKAVCFKNAGTNEFKHYAKQVVTNCQAFAKRFNDLGYRIVSGGTDNHLFTIDVKTTNQVTGKLAADLLHAANITSNKNSIPNDSEKPVYTSGIRLGTAAMTTRGLKEGDFIEVADIIHYVLQNHKGKKELSEMNKEVIETAKQKILNITKKFPLYPSLNYK